MLYAVTIFLFIAVGYGVVPNLLLTRLQAPYVLERPPSWGQKNAIILLGGGSAKIPDTSADRLEVEILAYGRVAKAAQLYSACKKNGAQCSVVISGGDPQHHGASEASVYGKYLQLLGVEKSDLLLEEKSLNTWQNAQFTAALLKPRDMDTVLLVTSAMHMNRSLVYFAHAGVHAFPVRADYIAAKRFWFPSYNLLMTDLALHEYVGIARYYVYNLLGWNAAAAKQD